MSQTLSGNVSYLDLFIKNDSNVKSLTYELFKLRVESKIENVLVLSFSFILERLMYFERYSLQRKAQFYNTAGNFVTETLGAKVVT